MLRNLLIKRHSSMLAWKLNHVDSRLENPLVLTETKIPTISSPMDLLVKVNATSVNPLDIKMVQGYGRKVLDLLHWATNFEVNITNDRYPLTLGRDFSGEVVAVGPSARCEFKPGDQIFGVIEPQKSGSHAHYVTTPSYCAVKKPSNLTHNQAASIPYVALTAYSAISTFGNINRNNCDGREVLVIGGSGGVGSFAIQLLKFWGANVIATSSQEKLDWLENELFVDRAVNHDDPTEMASLQGRFDFVLDAGSYDSATMTREDIVKNSLKFLKSRSCGVYVTLSPPTLNNTDQYGIIRGSVKTALDVVGDSIRAIKNLNSARWAFFLPNKSALKYISSLHEDEIILPKVSHVFNFRNMPDAFRHLEGGLAKGKVIVEVHQSHNERLSPQTDATQPEKAPIT